MSQNLGSAVAVIGIDIGKNSFQVVELDRRGVIVLRCTKASQPIDVMGHSRPGQTSSKSGHVRLCSNCGSIGASPRVPSIACGNAADAYSVVREICCEIGIVIVAHLPGFIEGAGHC